MSEKVFIIDLNNMTCDVQKYSYETAGSYGRGLLIDLFCDHVSDKADRYSPENIIAIVPGLFTGNPAPSACRMLVATIEGREKGIQVSNTTGNMPQKLGSLGIAAVVLKGCSEHRGTVVHISSKGVEFSTEPQLNDAFVSDIYSALRTKYGKDCAIIGSGIAGDMRMPLSGYFCSYPEGQPAYHCPRHGFGDVWGSKNLRAVVVTGDEYFGRECCDRERFVSAGRKLTRIIINDDICGGALPAYGSTAIMKILSEERIVSGNSREHARPKDENISGPRMNKTCAPMCVIGCLNRHSDRNGLMYRSPSQVETRAAIEKCFGTDDFALSDEVQRKATEIGIVATEFVTACKTFAETQNIDAGENYLLDWLDEIASGTLTGRVIASRTFGVSALYGDVEMQDLIDRRAIEDEHLYKLRMSTAYKGLSGLDEMQLLYAQVFVLENLGICIFTSSALLDNTEAFDLLAEMFTARTGAEMSGEKLIVQASRVMERERVFTEHRWKQAQESNIPPFTKVLYRYFGEKRE